MCEHNDTAPAARVAWSAAVDAAGTATGGLRQSCFHANAQRIRDRSIFTVGSAEQFGLRRTRHERAQRIGSSFRIHDR